MKPSWLAAKPIQQIDVRTFDHDIQVLKSRLLIEESEQGTDWISDRQLKCLYPEFYRRYGGDATPDGVYTSQNGKAIAFEFEIAQKSKQQYCDKLRRYTYNIRSQSFSEGPKYDLVRIICQKQSVYEAICDEVTLWKNYFVIEMADSFFANLNRMSQHPVSADPLTPAVGMQ